MRAPSENRKKIKYIVLGLLLALFYMGGAIQTLTTGYGFTFSPIAIIRCCSIFGYPWSTFFVLILLMVMVFGYCVINDYQKNGGADVLGRAFFQNKKRQTYGDTHFETPAEFKEVALVQTPRNALGTIFGQIDDSGKKLINQRMSNTRDNRHIMVVGSSGSGKTFTFVKPYCYQAVKRRESVIITDPDGGLFRDMAGYFQDHGYVVRQLNLKDLEKSDGWDCMKCVRGKNAELVSQLFAHTIIRNLVDNPESIYGTGPLSLLKACILRVVLDDEMFPGDKKNIQSVYSLINHPNGEEFLDTMFDIACMPDEAAPCVKPYMSFKSASPNLRGNLVTNLSVSLNLLQNELLCKVLSTDDMDLSLPGKQPCAYFCQFPDYHDTYKFIIALFFSMLFIQLTEYADSRPDGLLPVPVNFLLDEFPSIGQIPDFSRKIATVRKRGMNICMIIQDITQLQQERLYKDTWTTIMGNCSTFISLGVNDRETAEWMTKRIGETTVSVETQQHEAMESVFDIYRRRNTGEGRRALLSYEELFRVDKDDVIILAQRHNPIFAKKFPHNKHPEAKKLRTILPDDIPSIYDAEARKLKREKEDAYISAYLLKYPMNKVNRDYVHMDEPTVPTSFWDELKTNLANWLKKTFGLVPAKTTAEQMEAEEADNISFLSLCSAEVDFDSGWGVTVEGEETFAVGTESAASSSQQPSVAAVEPEIEDASEFIPDFGAIKEREAAPSTLPPAKKKPKTPHEKMMEAMLEQEGETEPPHKPTAASHDNSGPSQDTKPATAPESPPSQRLREAPGIGGYMLVSRKGKKPHKTPEAEFAKRMASGKPNPQGHAENSTAPNYLAPPPKKHKP